MKFEEILPLMREGKRFKLNNPNIKDSWFAGMWIICNVKLPDYPNYLDYNEEPWLSLVCLDKDGRIVGGKDSWGIPAWMIMSEDWEIVE